MANHEQSNRRYVPSGTKKNAGSSLPTERRRTGETIVGVTAELGGYISQHGISSMGKAPDMRAVTPDSCQNTGQQIESDLLTLQTVKTKKTRSHRH